MSANIFDIPDPLVAQVTQASALGQNTLIANRLLENPVPQINTDNGTLDKAQIALVVDAIDTHYTNAVEIAGQWQTVVYENLGWAGIAAGTLPRLELAPNGSLRLITENSAIGRNRWEQVLTIAHRDGAYRVAGYTHAFYDTLDLDSGGFCDVNLLTGRGLLQIGKGEERAVREWAMRAPPLADWTIDSMPPVCAPLFEN